MAKTQKQKLMTPKERKSEYDREYRRKNKVKIQVRSLAHYEKNRDRLIEKSRKYYSENKESIKAIGKENYKENREEVIKNNLKRYYRNREARLAYSRKYYQENKESILKNMPRNREKANALKHKRRAMKLNALPTYANLETIRRKFRVAKIMSSLGGGKYHVDHIAPLQGKLVCGFHHEDNLQILKAKDNISKNNSFTPFVLSYHNNNTIKRYINV